MGYPSWSGRCIAELSDPSLKFRILRSHNGSTHMKIWKTKCTFLRNLQFFGLQRNSFFGYELFPGISFKEIDDIGWFLHTCTTSSSDRVVCNFFSFQKGKNNLCYNNRTFLNCSATLLLRICLFIMLPYYVITENVCPFSFLV